MSPSALPDPPTPSEPPEPTGQPSEVAQPSDISTESMRPPSPTQRLHQRLEDMQQSSDRHYTIAIENQSELRRLLYEAQKEHVKAEKEHVTRVEAMSKLHLIKIEELMSSHRGEVERLQQLHGEKIETMRNAHQNEVDREKQTREEQRGRWYATIMTLAATCVLGFGSCWTASGDKWQQISGWCATAVGFLMVVLACYFVIYGIIVSKKG